MYDSGGETYVADYHFLGSQTVTSAGLILTQTRSDVFAAFSMPRGGSNYRGYVAYSIEELQPCDIYSYFNYTHQRSWLQYPAVTAMEKRLTTSANRAGVFLTILDEFGINTSGESAELFG